MKDDRKLLTISGHAHRKALLEAAVLTAVPVHAHDRAVLVLRTYLVVDVLLDAAAEETLQGAVERGHCGALGTLMRRCFICTLDRWFIEPVYRTLQPSQA